DLFQRSPACGREAEAIDPGGAIVGQTPRDRLDRADQSPTRDALEWHPVLAPDQLRRLGLAGGLIRADVDERDERDARRGAPMPSSTRRPRDSSICSASTHIGIQASPKRAAR